MSDAIDEATAGRLERSGARARALLGRGASRAAEGAESTDGGSRPPGLDDASLIAERIGRFSTIDAQTAAALAADLVGHARNAVAALEDGASDAELTEQDALAIESVLQVRGRPALRLHGDRLESLESHPGSEFWQLYIAASEARIVAACAATGAAIVSALDTGNPPWLQGSAWLVAADRVVTNRHVLMPKPPEEALAEVIEGEARMRAGRTITIEFAADDRAPRAALRRPVTRILYLAAPRDPIDVAVLEIEPHLGAVPLVLAAAGSVVPDNLFVIGHPAAMLDTPEAVRAVFGNPDGRKRVSFGKRLPETANGDALAHDASTVGGYSGGPVVGISSGLVAGLHYYGDPVTGNLAVTSAALREHAAYRQMASAAQ